VGCAVLQLVERREIEALTYAAARLPMDQAFQEEYVRSSPTAQEPRE
jgi:hypothetical protein